MWLKELGEISITKCLHSQNSESISHVQEKIKKTNRGKITKTGQKENITLVIPAICHCWETDYNTDKLEVQPFKIMVSPFNI